MFKKINWLVHFIELLVVIIGITIAFQLNVLKENSKNNKKEKTYLKSLQDDLDVDIEKLDTLIQLNEQKIHYFNRLISMCFQPDQRNDSLFFFVSMNYYSVPFQSQSISYSSLSNSGNLDLIADYGLRTQIVSLYEQKYEALQLYDKVLMNYSESYYNKYGIENIRHTSYNKVDTGFLSDYVFHNLIFSLRGIMSQKVGFEKEVLQSAKDLRRTIEEKTSE